MTRALRPLLYMSIGLSIFYRIPLAFSQENVPHPQASPVENPIPVSDHPRSMYIAEITPEEADSYAQQLQAARVTNSQAQIQIDLGLPSEPVNEQVFFELSPDGQTKAYVLASDGTKRYFPPTSAAFFALRLKQSVDQEIASLRSPSIRHLALVSFMSPNTALLFLKYASSVLSATVYADIPPASSACSASGQHCFAPTVGSGSSSDKGNLAAIRHPGYDYAPAVLYDGGIYKMWWCGDNDQSGDNIYYAESTSAPFLAAGSWVIPTSLSAVGGRVLAHSNVADTTFDNALICDPSVVKVGGMYYMYYGGNTFTGDNAWGQTNRIGVVHSTDGITWLPTSGRTPIIDTYTSVPPNTTQPYGAGHPSVVYVDGYFYMSYDDDTRINPSTSLPYSGQFALRSADYLFQSNVEEWHYAETVGGILLPAGWYRLNGAPPSAKYSYRADANGVDWAFAPATQEFIVGINGLDVQLSG
jgi:hypothetical protein